LTHLSRVALARVGVMRIAGANIIGDKDGGGASDLSFPDLLDKHTFPTINHQDEGGFPLLALGGWRVSIGGGDIGSWTARKYARQQGGRQQENNITDPRAHLSITLKCAGITLSGINLLFAKIRVRIIYHLRYFVSIRNPAEESLAVPVTWERRGEGGWKGKGRKGLCEDFENIVKLDGLRTLITKEMRWDLAVNGWWREKV
jgi:hypothetical protein